MRAADRGDADAVEGLLRGDATQQAPRQQLTPQRLAMRHGHVETLRLLQQHGGDQLGLDRPPAASPSAVVMRWYYSPWYWIVLGVLPAVVGAGIGVVGVVNGSWSTVSGGLALAAFGAVLTGLIVGLNGLERFAFDGRLFWYRTFRTWQGPVDLENVLAVYFVPASSGGKLFLLQADAGTKVKARTSHGFDAATVASLNATRELRSLPVTANTSSMFPGYLTYIARFVLNSPAIVDGHARHLLAKALAADAASRSAVT